MCPATLGYAYAGLEPNPFDKSKDDIVILLTDAPVPDDLFAGKTVSSAARAPAVKNSLLFVFREDKQQAGEPVAVGKDRVEATLSTEPQDAFGDKYEFHVAFNAVVKPRAK